jgi:hypothetical protein
MLICPRKIAYARTLENSVEGDITKLSLVLDQEIKCCILWSSSMLHKRSVTVGRQEWEGALPV